MSAKKVIISITVITLISVIASLAMLYICITSFAADMDNAAPGVSTVNTYQNDNNEPVEGNPDGKYFVYCKDILKGIFITFDEAKDFAKDKQYVMIKQKGKSNILWDNYPAFNVFNSPDDFYEFNTYTEAVRHAKDEGFKYVFFRKANAVVWENGETKSSALIHGVPNINQMPELAKGCEVTSLAMLIKFIGIEADKMTLAEEITKNPQGRTVKNGVIYGGDPNDGFIGDMTSKSKFGLGVYHKPIYELLQKYVPNSAIDLTGCDFEDLYYFINNESPVWVIINSKYTKLPKSEFEKWVTPNGTVDITYREHSVLITGYDEKNIYFNDPLNSRSSAPKADFINAWEQMGRQAISIAK